MLEPIFEHRNFTKNIWKWILTSPLSLELGIRICRINIYPLLWCLTYSRLWGTKWPQRRAMWQRRPWRRRRASSASWDPPTWWRYQSGNGKSLACFHAAHCSDRSSPHSAASYAEHGLVKTRGGGVQGERQRRGSTILPHKFNTSGHNFRTPPFFLCGSNWSILYKKFTLQYIKLGIFQ